MTLRPPHRFVALYTSWDVSLYASLGKASLGVVKNDVNEKVKYCPDDLRWKVSSQTLPFWVHTIPAFCCGGGSDSVTKNSVENTNAASVTAIEPKLLPELYLSALISGGARKQF